MTVFSIIRGSQMSDRTRIEKVLFYQGCNIVNAW